MLKHLIYELAYSSQFSFQIRQMLCNVCEECQVIQLILIAQEVHILMFALHKDISRRRSQKLFKVVQDFLRDGEKSECYKGRTKLLGGPGCGPRGACCTPLLQHLYSSNFLLSFSDKRNFSALLILPLGFRATFWSFCLLLWS